MGPPRGRERSDDDGGGGDGHHDNHSERKSQKQSTPQQHGRLARLTSTAAYRHTAQPARHTLEAQKTTATRQASDRLARHIEGAEHTTTARQTGKVHQHSSPQPHYRSHAASHSVYLFSYRKAFTCFRDA